MPPTRPTPSPVRQIVQIDYADRQHDHRVPIHVHPFCKVEIVLAGAVRLVTPSDEPILLEAGDGAVVPPFTPHGYEPRAYLAHTAIKFHLHPHYRFTIGRQVMRFRVPDHVVEAARCCAGSVSTLADAAATYCATYALHNLLLTAPSDSDRDATQETFAHVLNRVTSDPTQAWSVTDMAEACHLSVSQFAKRFRRAFGQSPQQFLTEARMIAAADLLIGTNWSVKRIAEQCGYANVHGFTRAFARTIGNPPAAFRRGQKTSLGKAFPGL